MYLTAPMYSPSATSTMNIQKVVSQLNVNEQNNILLPSLATCGTHLKSNTDDDMKLLLNKFAFHNSNYFLQPTIHTSNSSSASSTAVSSPVVAPMLQNSLPSPSLSPQQFKLDSESPNNIVPPKIVVEETDQIQESPKPKRVKRRTKSASSMKKAPIKVVFDSSNSHNMSTEAIVNGVPSPATSPKPKRKNSTGTMSRSPFKTFNGCLNVNGKQDKKVLLGHISKPSNKVYSNRSSVIKLKDNTQKIEQRRKHICQICLTGFTTSGHLSRHAKIHTGEKSHVCPHEGCNQSFSRHDNCLQHYRTHSKKKEQSQSP